MAIGCVWGQAAAVSSSKPPLLTVCQALNRLKHYNGKSVVLVGKLVTTMEGAWLVEDCQHKLRTADYMWDSIVSLTYVPAEEKPPPAIGNSFRWDEGSCQTKLQQIQRTTKLGEHEKWVAAFGRFETRVPLRVIGRRGWGFGHLNAAPAQLIASDDAFHELKPK
jgi:hypothetical protein